jgi:hypothetical protein
MLGQFPLLVDGSIAALKAHRAKIQVGKSVKLMGERLRTGLFRTLGLRLPNPKSNYWSHKRGMVQANQHAAVVQVTPLLLAACTPYAKTTATRRPAVLQSLLQLEAPMLDNRSVWGAA